LTIIKNTTFEFGRKTGYQTNMRRLSRYISFRRRTVNKYSDRDEINTRADTAPVNVRPYRLPEIHKTEVNWQIQEMLKNKIIRTSVSQ